MWIVLYYISLGTNLGDRGKNIRDALTFLQTLGEIIRISSVYETEPVGMDADSPWFLNLVLSIRCGLDPHEMLARLKLHELNAGRVPSREGKQSRPIDLDVLLADDFVIDQDGLTVPHPRMGERAFVMIPLAEIAPDLVHPVMKKTVGELSTRLRGRMRVIKMDDVLPEFRL